ncbi:MAG: response regulator [Planctomycetes bacterium]|nr:response regulator [Planctomycetota bacterium]MCB9918444.1 response regulator [Planctomycetota bacterium]
MTTPRTDDLERVRELEARIHELENENVRLHREAADVATANVHAAMQLVEFSDARNLELEAKNAQIHHALQLAEQASEQKSRFLANMSHELRTPISGILGMVELLSSSELDEQQRDLVSTIASTADSFLELIHQLLDFTKVEAGAVELEETEFDVWDTCERVAQLLQVSADQKGVTFDFVLDGDVPRRAIGDPLRLRQILLNLGSNAVKFTERGIVRFSVMNTVSDDERNRLTFRFEDTGCGFAPEIGERLFEPFVQADVSTTRRFGGTGLGLSICKQLVLRMDGDINCSSEVDLGSTFEACIPFAAVDPVVTPRSMSGMRAHLSCLRPSTAELVASHFENLGIEIMGDPFSDACCDQGCRSVEQSDWVVIEVADDPKRVLECVRKASANARVLLVAGTRSIIKSDCLEPFGVRSVFLPPLRPTALVHALISDIETKVATNAASIDGDFTGTRVLVVDDTKINRRALSIQLERLGCSVDCAANGKEALEIWRRGKYDVVFMDCQMPGLDGYAVTEAIRRMERARRAPRCAVIALTADTSPEVEARCLEAGMDEFCVKPLRRAQIADCLDRWKHS